MINEQQRIFLTSLLEENKPEHLTPELALDRLSGLVDQKLRQGISFHLAAHQAINELVLENRQTKLVPEKKTTWIVVAIGVLFLVFSGVLAFYLYQKTVNSQSPTLFPIAQFSISEFEGDIRPNSFKGVDITVPEHSEVMATGSGEVIMIEMHPQMGSSIVIRHNEDFKTVYGYLSKVLVKEGDSVKKGEKIGESGVSKVSLSPNLHYAIIENEHFIDPIRYMRSAIIPSPSL